MSRSASTDLVLPAREEPLSDAEIEAWVRPRGFTSSPRRSGEDEHSVGLHEILDIKHGGIEKYGFHCHNLGTSVPIERILDAAQQTGARAVLISTIVTHAHVHEQHMRRLHALAESAWRAPAPRAGRRRDADHRCLGA